MKKIHKDDDFEDLTIYIFKDKETYECRGRCGDTVYAVKVDVVPSVKQMKFREHHIIKKVFNSLYALKTWGIDPNTTKERLKLNDKTLPRMIEYPIVEYKHARGVV